MELDWTHYLQGAGMVKIMLQLVVEVSGKTIRFSHREGKVAVVLGLDMGVGDHLHQIIWVVIKEIGRPVVVGILQVTRVLDIKTLHMQGLVEVTRIIQPEEVRWMVQSVW